jgi:hypothetical protein
MKLKFTLTVFFLIGLQSLFAQDNDNVSILKMMLTKYYANEKPIVKDRLQLLSFYCEKAPNNEELFEVIDKNTFLKKYENEIKSQINPSAFESWNTEYNLLFNNQNQYLQSKVQKCLSFDEFNTKSTNHKDNNHRLLIIGKPIYFAQKFCLVKVAMYRTIEHNSGRFFLLEKTNGQWIIKETLNEWNT